jgi:hypothetical protein
MDFEVELISQTLEHRGCGIRAASYEICPESWLPEACVWLQTETGQQKVWVHSFAHCFAAEDLMFSNQLEADSWALAAAKKIIDRALEEDKPTTVLATAKSARALSGLRRIGNCSLFPFNRFLRS